MGKKKPDGRSKIYKAVFVKNGFRIEVFGSGSNENQARYAIAANARTKHGIAVNNANAISVIFVGYKTTDNDPPDNTAQEEDPEPSDSSTPRPESSSKPTEKSDRPLPLFDSLPSEDED